MSEEITQQTEKKQTIPPARRSLSSYLFGLVRNRLWLKVLIGMFLGLLTGIILGPSVGLVEPATGSLIGNWLAFPGRLFIATIQMIVIPLVIASVVRGLASTEDMAQLRKVGIRVVLFFTAMTALASTIGLWVGQLFSPGKLMQNASLPEQRMSDFDAPTGIPNINQLPDLLLGLLPGNPLDAMVQGQMLQVVIFSIIVGVALVTMPSEHSRPMLDLLRSLQQICMTVVHWAMKLAPYAVFGLMAQLTTSIGFNALLGMASYVLTVTVGLLLLMLIYLLLLRVVAGQHPVQFLKYSRDVLLLAFSTSSSAAVMPLSIRTAQDKLAVRPSIAQFVIPLGATINMNGTALYQSVATIFLAQVYGVDLSMASMALVVALAVGASIGSPATPGVGIIILSTVLTSVGIPPSGIALIMGVDRILDMLRTAVNVTGDLVTSRLMEAWARKQVVPAEHVTHAESGTAATVTVEND
jgi:Na+/H+-dicarboxylate symporter